MKWFAIRRIAHNDYYLGKVDEFTTELANAKLYTEAESEIVFLFKGEEWFVLTEQGDAQ